MRKFVGKARIALGVWLIAFTLFQLYTEATIPLPPFLQNGYHLLFVFTGVFLLYPVLKGKTKGIFLAIDIILCLAVVAFTMRHILQGYEKIPVTEIARPGLRDLIFGILFLLVTLETTRRTMGWPLVIVSLCFIAYAFLGPIIPGVLGHEGVQAGYFIGTNYLTGLGSLGTVTSLSSGMIFAVVAFGAFMLALGGGDLIIKIAVAAAGKFRGGPAKVGIIGSALFGTITGSAVANIGVIGVYTIPMMKRVGYQPEFAAAVEACASSGGMIMPPVMGVAAFIMVEFLGIPYSKLIIYALIPAIFYFVTLFIQVHLRAVKGDLKPLPQEEIAAARRIPKADWILMLPLLILVYLLVVKQMDVSVAAFYGSMSVWGCFVVHEFVLKRRVDFKRLMLSFEQPARQMLALACALTCIGILVYSIDITGLATKISTVLIDLAGGNLWFLLILTMIASLILGMGLPASACYIFLAILAAPALVKFGVSPLAAHMFIFYFGMMSAITPPVCLSSYVAAGIAGADSMKVAVQGTKLGISGYIVPFMFVKAPTLLLQAGSVSETIWNCSTLLVASVAIAIAVEGFFFRPVNWLWRAAGAVSAALLVYPGMLNGFIGLGLLVLLIVVNWLPSRKAKAVLAGNGQ